MNKFRYFRRCALMIVCCAIIGGISNRAAAEELTISHDPLAAVDMVDDDLLIFQDLPTVISAARHSQPINESAVAVSVLSADDIHYSGLTRIPELLQFVPGVDVLQIDRNRYAVGVRGMHSVFNERTLTLINGRSAASPAFGGADFLRLPVFVEDIERIEVVRGPGSAAWGANALTGVINIITKDPEDTLGLFATTTFNEYGDSYSHVRWGHKKDDWVWRISVGYDDWESSEDAIDDDEFASRDFQRNARFDAEATHYLSSQTHLNLGLGYTQSHRGDFEFVGYQPMDDEDLHTVRMFARLTHEFDSGATGYIQWFTNIDDVDRPSELKYESYENDIEVQFDFDYNDNHHLTLGGNFRWNHINTKESRPLDLTFLENPFDDFWFGFFGIDRWTLNDHLTLETQLRFDYYSRTQADWSGRIAALYGLDDDKQHMLRFSAAKAFRQPMVALQELTFSRVQVMPGVFATSFLEAKRLDNEQVYSFEAGYTGRLTESLTLRADAYYQVFDELVGAQTVSTTLIGGVIPATVFRIDNIDGARAWGTELELAWRKENWSASAWYAYNGFQEDRDGQQLRAYPPAPHKVGLTARARLPLDATVNANYRYTSRTPRDPSLPEQTARPSHRLDLTLSKVVADGRGEIMLGVTDLLDNTDGAVMGIGALTEHETPGRTFFGRVQFTF